MTNIEIERLEDAARRVFGFDDSDDSAAQENDGVWFSRTLNSLWKGPAPRSVSGDALSRDQSRRMVSAD